jgi:TldD protein
MYPKNYYTDLFKVTESQLQELTSTALAHGGDYCDLYFEHTTFFNLLLKDSIVSSGGFHTDFGVGIRVLKGEKTGYAYSENTEMKDMLGAAKAASAMTTVRATHSPGERFARV